MPSWTRNRASKPKEKTTERKNQRERILEHTQDVPTQPSLQTVDHGTDELTRATSRRARRLRDSVVSLSAVNEAFGSSDRNPDRLEVPENSETPVKSNRFSLLKFRHASDSQLSRTAREHASHTGHTPPVPKCMPTLKHSI